MAKLLIVKTGSTVPSVLSRRRDFEVWITTGSGLPRDEVQTVSVYLGETPPDPAAVQGIIVTGSASMVTDREPWSLQTEEWLKEATGMGVPVLGICYGHQLLAQALGGTVTNNPLGRNIGTVEVALNEEAAADPLFGQFTQPLHVPVSHVQSVAELPTGAKVLGTTQLDPNHVFAYGDACWGVQFHPEFDAAIVREYVDARRGQIEAEGLDPEAIKDRAIDSADGAILLRRFARLIGRKA